MNKQPKDGDKPADHLLDNNSFDLLGLHDDDSTGGQGREQSGTSLEGRTLSTGRSYQPRGDKDAATPEGEKPPEGSGEAISYYNAETRKFRRREGHGPQRMARKQRIWDDWLSWRDAWRAETVAGKPGPDQGHRRRRRKPSSGGTRSGRTIWLRSEGEAILQGMPHRHRPLKKNGCRTSMVNGSKFGARSAGEALHSIKEETATRIKVTHTGENIDEVDVTLSNRYNLEAANPGDTPAGTKMASGMTMEEIHHGLRIGEGPPPPSQSEDGGETTTVTGSGGRSHTQRRLPQRRLGKRGNKTTWS